MFHWTLNANKTVEPLIAEAQAGRVWSITKRWTSIANSGTYGIVLDVKSIGAGMLFTTDHGGDTYLDVYVIQSYSAGSAPKIGNRNILTTLTHTCWNSYVIDPTIEAQASSVSIIERYIPGGTGVKAAGGGFNVDIPIYGFAGLKVYLEWRNMSGSTYKADMLMLIQEGTLDSRDYGPNGNLK